MRTNTYFRFTDNSLTASGNDETTSIVLIVTSRSHRLKINYLKLPKYGRGFALAWLVCFAITSLNSYFHLTRRNDIRKEILSDSGVVAGVVIDIFPPFYVTQTSIHPGHAFYSFQVGGQKYTGNTFFTYNGKIDDTISVVYQERDPRKNIYIKDFATESIRRNVFYRSAINTSILIFAMALFCVVSFFWKRRRRSKADLAK
jgi:hypothetical protein